MILRKPPQKKIWIQFNFSDVYYLLDVYWTMGNNEREFQKICDAI
jgi:hypothetical protein